MSEHEVKFSLQKLCSGLPSNINEVDKKRPLDSRLPHAPRRRPVLSEDERKLCVKNALRYFKYELHDVLKPEFEEELQEFGHIYMYRLMPELKIKAYPISWFPAKSDHAKVLMHMIFNNLDHAIAQFPQELVVYGGNGQIFSNWAQFRLVMYYLSKMTDEQTLILTSGHPMGLFPSSRNAPRAVITNGMMIPNYSKAVDYDKYFAMGVTMYGQMTAGSFCYIGPQGIVHGTAITVKNAGRRYLKRESLKGVVYATSGLGGMSGAQAKAGVIAGCVALIAEVSLEAIKKRHSQGWLTEWYENLEKLIDRVRIAKKAGEAVSIAYYGNVVDLWERLVEDYDNTGECLVELGSDQTSLHNPYNGGYYPVGLSYEESRSVMVENSALFMNKVDESLRRHVAAINALTEKTNMRFWDYGNAFLLQSGRAGADVFSKSNSNLYRYPSYFEDIMGNIFALGFGPFRWICTSADDKDLAITDKLAVDLFSKLASDESLSVETRQQYRDNLEWIMHAGENDLVVGSKARILYSDLIGRQKLAQAFNAAVADGRISAPVVLSRDHHDVSGTDSPFRETADISDGSKFCADMAVQNAIGDSFRGATWVALHNGGGVGWGEVVNGGFGLVLDGTKEAHGKATSMLNWDVINGVARRAWGGHPLAQTAVQDAMTRFSGIEVTPSYYPK